MGPHSSGVEHSLGKGEVESSNLSVGTILFFRKIGVWQSGGKHRNVRDQFTGEILSEEFIGAHVPWSQVLPAFAPKMATR